MQAYIVAYGRSVAAKAKQGALFHERPDDVAAKVLQGVLKRIDGKFNKNMIEDVIVAVTAFPEGLQGQNIARTIALRTGLSRHGTGSNSESLLLIRITNHRDCSQSNYGWSRRYTCSWWR